MEYDLLRCDYNGGEKVKNSATICMSFSGAMLCCFLGRRVGWGLLFFGESGVEIRIAEMRSSSRYGYYIQATKGVGPNLSRSSSCLT